MKLFLHNLLDANHRLALLNVLGTDFAMPSALTLEQILDYISTQFLQNNEINKSQCESFASSPFPKLTSKATAATERIALDNEIKKVYLLCGHNDDARKATMITLLDRRAAKSDMDFKDKFNELRMNATDYDAYVTAITGAFKFFDDPISNSSSNDFANITDNIIDDEGKWNFLANPSSEETLHRVQRLYIHELYGQKK